MSLLVEEYVRSLAMILDKGDIESDSYNNALSIKMIIEKLYKEKNLIEFDMKVLNFLIVGYSYSEVADLLHVDRKRVTQTFKKVCTRVAFILGEEFTNTGFLTRAEENK